MALQRAALAGQDRPVTLKRCAALLSGKLVVASHNAGKVREIRDLLAPFAVDVISAAELGLPEPEETGDTFIANAELKARAAAHGVRGCRRSPMTPA